MTLYLDSSALVKRYVKEAGSDSVIEAMRHASAYKMCRIGIGFALSMPCIWPQP